MTPQDALATIPKKIKVGPHTYEVRIVKTITGDPDAMAAVFPETQVIELLDSISSASYVVDCTIHELLHAIWSDRDLGKRADEEKVVLQFSSGLVQLIQDNPKLLPWIRRGLR